MEAVRSWLRQQVNDANEEGRTWKLRAIQAEAELRALQVDLGSEGETQALLSEVLGLEKHLQDWEPWRNKLVEATKAAKEESKRLQASLEVQNALLPQAEREGTEARLEAQVLREARGAATAAHEARLEAAAKEIHQALAASGLRPQGALISMAQGEARLRAVQTSVTQLEEDVKETERQREELSMRLEELGQRHLDDLETHQKSVKDVQAARQALQARQSSLTKLQGEASRGRSRWEKKKKQLEVQLSQLALESKDAKARLEAAEEALRKVRAAQSKQLLAVKRQTNSLQAEVDAHLEACSKGEEEMQALRQRQMELREGEERFEEQEEQLREQAVKARERLGHLEQHTERLEDQRRQLLEELQPLEEEWEQLEMQVKALRELAEADSLRAKEHQEAALLCKEELSLHKTEFAAQADELTMLSGLEKEVLELKKRQKTLAAERNELEIASKALQTSLDQQLLDLREAQRRSAQLKAAHEDFVKLLPPNSLRTVGMTVASEQALGRISRKAEQLQGYLEGGRPNGRRKDSEASGKLAEQLMQAAAAIVRQELSDSRRQLLELQQSVAEATRRRGQEILSWRSQRRQLEEELSVVEAKVQAETSAAAAVLGELESHLKALREAAAQEEAKVAAEVAELKKQQGFERVELKSEVAKLKRAEEEEMAAQAAVVEREQERRRLRELDSELARLRLEEEQLLQAHVALRAALGRRAKSLPPPPGERCEGRGEATTPSSGHGPLPAQGQLLLSTTSRPSAYSGSDASKVQPLSPETSPRMAWGALATSLPALVQGTVPRPIFVHNPDAKRGSTTSIIISPRHYTLDKVYTWPRPCHTLEHLDLRNSEAARQDTQKRS